MERKTQDVRGAVVEALRQLMKENKDVYFVTADMGAQFPGFDTDFPERYIDVGIAEQNMVSISAGLAYSGKIAYNSTLATFASLRVAEQIRTDCCYPGMNVNIFGQGRGLAYGFLGATHHAPDDIGVLRSMAGITIILPVDAIEARKMVFEVAKYPGPTYMGIPRGAEPVLNDEDYSFEIGKAVLMKKGTDVTIIATGAMVIYALDAADMLEREGIKARVINMHTIKPLDEIAVRKAAEETGAIVTVEDHNIIGGLGGAVAEIVVETSPVPMRRVGVPDCYCAIGHFEELIEKYSMSTPHIISAVKDVLKRKK